jgi:LacI family repressor for deo operon, udp, cdd, tsx, nupC, and nupG
MKASLRAGLRDPEAVAVVGFNDVTVADMFEPSITTIAQPMYALGQRAFSLLLQRIKGENAQSEILPQSHGAKTVGIDWVSSE